MTLADFRGIKKPEGQDDAAPAVADVQAEQLQREEEAAAHREGAHPSPLEYVKIGLALAIVTAIEVALFYMDIPQRALIAILMVLSTLKFVLVVMWFMHLKFDNRLFSVLFTGGLILAVALFIVVLATLGGGIV